MDDAVAVARGTVLDRFRWIDGHSDMWRLAEEADTFAAITRGLAALAATLEPTGVIGIETRGVLFGAPVALALGVGFHTVRKTDGLFAGSRDSQQTAADYRGRTHTLRTRAEFGPDDRVVLIDDWIETGSQASAVKTLVERAGATWAGIVTIVDQSTISPRSLVSAADLPEWHGA